MRRFRDHIPLLLLVLAAGCMSPLAPSRAAAMPEGQTLLIHLPGIGGDTPFDRWWMESLQSAGAADRVELYDWTRNRTWVDSLQGYARNRRQARIVVDRIVRLLRDHPNRKVILTGESGGAGIALFTLEALPNDVQVEQLVLVAPAVSPGYDLSPALRHVRRQALVFISRGDVLMLGLGTRLYGTIDRQDVAAAGLVGFHPPKNADLTQYQKLKQIGYNPDWWVYGDFGSHAGAMSTLVARFVIAPRLNSTARNEPTGSEPR